MNNNPVRIVWYVFIPARAGNGMNSGVAFVVILGSSPRVRGTAQMTKPDGGRYRFIPARAGNGFFSVRRTGYPTVHPRACGERSSFMSPKKPMTGSSPRVRGTERLVTHREPSERFIPARAGNGP